MAISLLVLEIVVPVFLVVAVGFLWARLGREFRVDFATRLSMTVAAPALLFSTLAQAEIEFGPLLDLVGATMLANLGAMALLWAGLRLFGLSMRVWLAPMTFGNTGNLGLPVAFYAYGEAGLALAMIVFAGMILVSFTLGLWVVTGGGSPREALRQPLLHAVAVGLVFGVLQIPVPTVAMRAVELIGQIAIPLMLLTLGVSVARLSPSGMGFAGLLSLLRLVPCGVAALGAAAVFGLDEAARNILILQAIMPAAVTSYLMAERYGAQPEKIAGLVVVSNALSAAYLPVALLILLGL